MAEIIEVTELPVRVTAVGKQDLRLAIDAAEQDEVDLHLLVSEGTNVAVKIITNMQNESENGWVDAGSFTATSATGGTKLNLKNFLRYLRWEVTGGTLPGTFSITGMGRRWG